MKLHNAKDNRGVEKNNYRNKRSGRGNNKEHKGWKVDGN